MLMDLVQLRTFVAVAEEEHLTRAAERLNMSQSAASSHIRAVEDRLGTQLFVRTNRSLELTKAGQLVALRARELLREEALFKSFARELRGEMEGRLVIGTSSAPGTRIGAVIAEMRQRHPLVFLDMVGRPSSGTRQGLASGELDAGIMLHIPEDPALAAHKLATVRYRVAGPAAWRDKIVNANWIELAALPWITPTASSAHMAMISQLFGARGLEANTVMSFDNATIGYYALCAGAGMMLLREDQALAGEQDGTFALSPIAKGSADLSVVYQAERQGDPLVKAFVNAAISTWPKPESEQVLVPFKESS